MAAILPQQPQQYQQPQQPQQPQQLQQLQQPQQSQQPQQDPLFQALSKYITSGPGPSSVTSANIEEIIGSVTSTDGGRSFLESVVDPTDNEPLRIWSNQRQVEGTLSTKMTELTLLFGTKTEGQSPSKITFRGTSPHFFPPQQVGFDNAQLYWDNISDSAKVRTELIYRTHTNALHVKFYDNTDNCIAVLHIDSFAAVLPPNPISGLGQFSKFD